MSPWHLWGGDLDWGATGDLRAVDGPEHGRQRVLRRLLTAEDGYPFVPDYGAGLPALVGEAGAEQRAEALARAGMALEQAVAADPPPEVGATADALGRLILSIRYTDAAGPPVALGFRVES